MKMHFPGLTPLFHTVVAVITTAVASPSSAAARIDASTLISVPHGTFSGVQFTRYEAMFDGVTSNNRPYRVPCQIIAPANLAQGSGTLLFDWLVEPDCHRGGPEAGGFALLTDGRVSVSPPGNFVRPGRVRNNKKHK